MKLILHQAWKDLRAERWLVAAWAAALVTLCAADLAAPGWWLQETRASRSAFSGPGAMLLVVGVSRMLLSWVIAVRVIHADPLDNSNAFWLTRPLSRRGLLASKALVVGGLLVVVPAVAAAVTFLLSGFPASHVAGLTARWLLPDLVVLVPLVLDACLTTDLARTVLAVIGVLAARLVLQFFTTRVYLTSAWSELIGDDLAIAVAWQRALLLLPVLAAALVAWHYLTRRPRRTLAAAAVVLVAWVAIVAAWPVQSMVARAHEARNVKSWVKEWNGGPGVRLSLTPGSLRSIRDLGVGGTRQSVLGEVRISGLPAGIVVDTLRSGTSRWQAAGEAEPIESRFVNWLGQHSLPGVAQTEENRRAVESVVGARLLDDPGAEISGRWRGMNLVDSLASEYERHQGQRGRYEATLDLVARRVSIAAAIPLVAGARVVLGDIGRVVEGTRTTTSLGAARSRCFQYFVVDLRTLTPRTLTTSSGGGVGYLLVNRKRNEAVPMIDGGVERAQPELLSMAALCVATGERGLFHRVDSGSPHYAETMRWFNPEWLADATLVFLSFEVLGRFDARLTEPDFLLPPLESMPPSANDTGR